jgi:hypothetical protein
MVCRNGSTTPADHEKQDRIEPVVRFVRRTSYASENRILGSVNQLVRAITSTDAAR